MNWALIAEVSFFVLLFVAGLVIEWREARNWR